MHISVAICTWNRAKLLDQTLTRMAALRIPQGVTWELLVVNNNCIDDTDRVIEKHGRALPLRRVFEPKPGHSNARNAAVENASGEVIIWTDDDVLVDSEWLGAYVEAASRWPEAAYFGGLIEPWFESPPPQWMTDNLGCFQGLLVIRDFGPEERPFRAGELPFGANMGFRTARLRQVPFDPDLGRKENLCILGDETQVIQTLNGQGYFGVWVPQAHVQHYVPRQRLQMNYVWQYFKGVGRTMLRMEGYVPAGEALLMGAPRWLYRRCWATLFRAWFLRMARKPAWIRSYVEAAQYAGRIEEVRNRCRSHQMQPLESSLAPSRQ